MGFLSWLKRIMGSPALAPPEVRDVTLSLFAGLKTDIAPSDIPEGLSPDTQDGIYMPGEWASRACLARLYANGILTAGKTVLYEKTYIQPNDDPLTLVLTSDGKLWVEDVGNSPGAASSAVSVAAGLYAQSVTEFGREYIAFSDLLHGQGIPLQFDGTNYDRVTQDGPGAAPTFADAFASVAITDIDFAFTSGFINSITEVGTLATLNCAGIGNNVIPGEFIFVINNSVAGYNGFQQVVGVIDANNITYNVATSGLGAGAGGNVCPNAMLVRCTPPANTHVGDAIVISGSTPAAGGFNPNNGGTGNPAAWQIFSVQAGGVYFTIPGSTQIPTSPSNATGGTVQVGGVSTVGVHQGAVMFLTRQGAITKPSPAFSFASVGNSKWTFSNLPIGPPNTVARILGFTGAGGDNFFIIPASSNLPFTSLFLGGANAALVQPIFTQATVVPDNTSTSYTLDVNDNALFAAVAIDQVGNDLFDQVVIGPVLGFFAFASRLSCWGDYNKVENFLNMGFCGGYLSGVLTAPLGWNSGGNVGGTLVNGGSWAAGQSWQITGDGSGSQKGLLTQSAYQDSFGDAILGPNTQYAVRFWAKASAAGLNGTVTLKLSSVSTGFSTTATFSINAFSTTGAFVPLANFTLPTPASIPADLILSLYETNLNNGQTVTLSELALVFVLNPVRDALSRWSYVDNPEGFALTTGNLGAQDDPSPIRCFALLRQSALLGTGEGVHSFSDTTAEPDEWDVNQITRSVGLLSVRSMDPGKVGTGDGSEDWVPVASKNGLYLFAGSNFWKITQEISRGSLPQSQDPRKTWDDINFAVQQTVVCKNDPATRRCYVSVPINGAATPNGLFVLDYREMDTAAQIAAAAPLHITISGKMKSSDLTRKWSFWNVAANDVEILVRPGNQRAIYFAGGNGVASANLYSLDPSKLTDDDFGAIAPYYTTYLFTDHEQEAALGLGAGLKLVKYLHAYIAGVGLVTITPIVNSLYNFQPALSQRSLVKDTDQSNYLRSDLEWTGVGIRGQRIAFRISVQPQPGTTDVQLRLQKLIVGMMKDPVAPFRQSGV